jgi:hypothetical protein
MRVQCVHVGLATLYSSNVYTLHMSDVQTASSSTSKHTEHHAKQTECSSTTRRSVSSTALVVV